VAINNFPGKQNALAVVNEMLDTFEIVGHYNEPQTVQLSESAVNRLPDGSWMAICRQDGERLRFRKLVLLVCGQGTQVEIATPTRKSATEN